MFRDRIKILKEILKGTVEFNPEVRTFVRTSCTRRMFPEEWAELQVEILKKIRKFRIINVVRKRWKNRKKVIIGS